MPNAVQNFVCVSDLKQKSFEASQVYEKFNGGLENEREAQVRQKQTISAELRETAPERSQLHNLVSHEDKHRITVESTFLPC